MSDFSLEDTGIPPTEDSIANLSMLNIHSSIEETQAPATDPLSSKNQVSLADLHQDYIDRIAKFLDPKSLLRLQFTCRALYQKGAAAQRLVEFTPAIISYMGFMGLQYLPLQERFNLKFSLDISRGYRILTEFQFKATSFRLRAGRLFINGPFSPVACGYIDDHIHGRGTIRHLDFGDVCTVDAVRFNKFLQDFHISELTMRELPVDYFNQPCVQKLEFLKYYRNFPLSPNFFTDSATHSAIIYYRSEDFDYDDLNLLLKKWAANEKIIKDFEFKGLNSYHFSEVTAFAGWRIVDENGEIPTQRPIVLRDTSLRFRLLRADGATLYVGYVDGDFKLSITELPEDEPPDDSDYDYDDYYERDDRTFSEWHSGPDVYYNSNSS